MVERLAHARDRRGRGGSDLWHRIAVQRGHELKRQIARGPDFGGRTGVRWRR